MATTIQGVGGSTIGADFLDNQVAKGYSEEKGDDWSYAKSSERNDRPFSNEELKVLTTKSDIKGLKQLALQVTSIVGAGVLIYASDDLSVLGPTLTELASSTLKAYPSAVSLSMRILGTTAMGFGLVTMGHCAQHECIHNTAFKSKWLNTTVSWLVSLPRLTNPAWEKMLHKDHHTYTNDPERDPEIRANCPKNAMPTSYLGYVQKILRVGGGKFFLGAWASRIGVLVNCALGNIVGYSGFDPVPEKKAKYVRPQLQSLCRKQLAFYAVCLGLVAVTPSGWSLVWKYWALPFLVGEPLHAIFHIADHLNCENDFKNGRINTRTSEAPYWVRFNLWNMNYHAEHHLYPSIPFHNLPKAHKELKKLKHFKHSTTSVYRLHKDLLTSWIPQMKDEIKASEMNKSDTNDSSLLENWKPYAESN